MKTIRFVLTAFIAILSLTVARATNYVNNGTFAAYNLNSGDTLRIAQGTFNGVITNLPAGAVIIVAPNTNFSPTVINLWAPVGKIINNGTCTINSMGIGAGFSVKNYGTFKVLGDMSFYSGILKTFENIQGGTLTITGSLAMNENTTIINDGIMNVTGSVSLHASTARLTNNNVITVGGSLSSQGALINENAIRIGGDFNYWGGQMSNTGQITPDGAFAIGSGLTYVNSCRLITKGALNNYGTLQNQGLVWAGTTNTSADQFTNSGVMINSNNAKLRTARFINYGTITGDGYLYATGQTTLGSGATIGVTGVTNDTLYFFDVSRSNPSRIFDEQWGTVRPNTVYSPFPAPDSLQLFPGCSNVFRTGFVLPINWNYFHVKTQQQPLLTWSAEFEAGMRFEIERSYNSTDFNTIGSVTADNTAAYSYSDATADMNMPYISYRIKAISTSGAVKHTEIKLIRNQAKNNLSISVFPNPSTDFATLVYSTEKKALLSIRLRAANGIEVLNKNFNAQPGTNRIPLQEVKNLSAGTYFVEIYNGNEQVATEKLVKR